jgi:predicted phosphoribosyltransferase
MGLGHVGSSPLFRNRVEAGRRLAQMRRGEAIGPNALVLALRRGGIPVAFEISQSLDTDFKPTLPIKDRTVVLVDDALATGASMLAAAHAGAPSAASHERVA